MNIFLIFTLFEALILTILVQLLWAANIRSRESGIRVLSEDEAMELLNARVLQGDEARVKVLSAGLSSRVVLLCRLVNRGIRTEVLAQDPKTALDETDAVGVEKKLGAILGGIDSDVGRNLLDIRYYPGVASVRCMILYDGRDRPLFVCVGWYTYHRRGTELRGFPNPTVVTKVHSKWGQTLVTFAETQFSHNLAEAGPNLVADMSRAAASSNTV